jgi:hypothetical protein
MPASYTGQYTVTFGSTDVTSQVINVNVRIGRQKITDRWVPDICQIELIPSSTFTAPTIGSFVKLTVTGASNQAFYGPVTDVQRTYGIPYNAGTGAAPADRVIVTAESWGKSRAGRARASAVSITAGSPLSNGISTLNTNLSTGITNIYFDESIGATLQQQGETYTGLFLDFINSVMISSVGYLQEWMSTANPSLEYATNGFKASLNYLNFTDTGSQSSATNTYFYNQIEFLSTIDNSYTQVTVSYNNGSGPNSATTGAAPYTTYSTTSNLQLSGQATDCAGIYLASLSQSATRPYRLVTNSSLVGSVDLDTVLGNQQDSKVIGSLVTVTFRGTTYNVILEGFNVSQDLEQATYTFYFSPAIGVPLVLTSTAFGILDTNTLGIG